MFKKAVGNTGDESTVDVDAASSSSGPFSSNWQDQHNKNEKVRERENSADQDGFVFLNSKQKGDSSVAGGKASSSRSTRASKSTGKEDDDSNEDVSVNNTFSSPTRSKGAAAKRTTVTSSATSSSSTKKTA